MAILDYRYSMIATMSTRVKASVKISAGFVTGDVAADTVHRS
jgi:hypothetical protein